MKSFAIIWTIAFALLLLYGGIKTMDIFADLAAKKIHGTVYVK